MLQDPAFRTPIAISLGAIAGALSRYYLSLWFTQVFGSSFPYGTFIVNLTGCFGMGFFVTLALERLLNLPPEFRLLITTGFLGAYTTFSTYALESFLLLRNRSFLVAGLYLLGSAFLGIVCIQLGILAARIGQ